MGPKNNSSFSLKSYVMEHNPESYAERGWAYKWTRSNVAETVMAHVPGNSLRSLPGTARHGRNLQELAEVMVTRYGNDVPKSIETKFNAAEARHIKNMKSPVLRGAGRGFVKGLLPAAFVGYDVYSAVNSQGSAGDRSFATGTALASNLGAWGGAKAGALIGAAVGGPIGGAVGFLAGGLAGYTGVSTVAYKGYDFANRLVENERRRRGVEWSEWGGQTQVFNTQRSATMRQRSLEAMNRGMMNARSLMGREAGFMHR
jgi:hypothetical protein